MFKGKGKSNKKGKKESAVLKEVKDELTNVLNEIIRENKVMPGNETTSSKPAGTSNRAEVADSAEMNQVIQSNEVESESAASSETIFCRKCSLLVSDNAVSCDFCLEWFHLEVECSNLDEKYAELISNHNIKYICNECNKEDGKLATMSPGKKSIRNTLDQLQSRLDTLFQMIEGVVSGTHSITREMDVVKEQLKVVNENENKNAQEKKTVSYADKLKGSNVLVIKSNQENSKAYEKRESIMSKLKTPVERTRPTKDGHLILNFADKQQLENAKKEMDENMEENISVKIKGKLKPKVKVCNISKDIDNVTENIINKNPWIENLIENEEDFKMVKSLKSKDKDKKHCIIKCSPKIRRAILDHDDKVYTFYESCNVYDSYSPYQCYKCQGYGHSAEKCTENQVCGKCGGNHKLKECTVAKKSCVNCIRKQLTDTEHATYEAICPVLIEEKSRIMKNTDHGVEQ